MKPSTWALAARFAVLASAGAVLSATPTASQPVRPRFAPTSMAYVLQADKLSIDRTKALALIATCDRDLVVIDPYFDGGPGGAWTAREIDALRLAKLGRKVVAYLSIGEAEDYRPYWRRPWDADGDGRPDSAAPEFLCDVNPQWKGNYKVRYWQSAWQDLLLAAVDEIVRQGFDGLYLDIVDAYEFFEYDPARKDWIDDRVNPETRRTYRQDMIDWVLRIAAHARRQAGRHLLVIPQNASVLAADKRYLDAVDAIGIEDLFNNGDRRQPAQHTAAVLKELRPVQKAGKRVLLIEYGRRRSSREISIRGAAEHGMVLLLAPRQLDALGTAYPPEKTP